MTTTLTNQQRAFVSILMTALFAVSLLLAVMPTPARAASLTEPQIQAIVNLLTVFGADQTTINNVNAVLHNQSTPATAVQTSGNTPSTTTSASSNGAPTTATTPSTATTVVTTPAITPTTASTTAHTPTAAAAPTPVCVLVANNSVATPGESITLTWKSANATYSSSPHGNTGPNGAVVVTPTATTIYQKTVYGPGGSAKCQVMVTVAPPQITAPTTTAPTPAGAVNTQMVMTQPEINVASVAAAVAQLPFALAINSLTNIFFELGIGQ